jgi:UDP-N-acetylmuramyl pentapeptide phosphotransferase/UDP-N-acetylglucosamine-1-phosphate transferase
MHFLVAFAGTWLARRYALRRALIDHPGERRSHAQPTPRGGGVGVVVALLAALGGLAWAFPSERWLLLAAATGLLLVAATGWVDDHRPLAALPRLAVHALAAALLGGALAAHGASPWLCVGSALLALVLVNVWNFMDGIDGLAASQAALAAGGYLAVAGGGVAGWLAASLLAGSLGFLPFNIPSARVFLGDVGSGALGFAIACIVALLALQLTWESRGLLLLPLVAFGVDAGLTLASRIVHKQRWWEPHVTHAYQRWARRCGHAPVTLAYAGWTLAAVVLMAWLVDGGWLAFGVAGTFVLSGVYAWRVLMDRYPDMEGME